RLDTAGLLLQGGDRGAAIVPGKSGESLLYLALFGKGDVTQMPLEQPPLKPAEAAIIQHWIDAGAAVPEHAKADAPRRQSDHWAFKPIRRPELPAVKDASRVENPIDLFLQARLER